MTEVLLPDGDLRVPIRDALAEIFDAVPDRWRLSFDETTHIYTTGDGRILPSVTRLLEVGAAPSASGGNGYDGYRFARQDVLDRGDGVHDALALRERFRASKHRPPRPRALEGFLRSYERFRDLSGWRPILVEHPIVGRLAAACPVCGSPGPCLHRDDVETLDYAGMFDALGVFTWPEGVPPWWPGDQKTLIVLDWKTAGTPGTMSLTVGPQVAGYVSAVLRHVGTAFHVLGGGVCLAEDGSFELERSTGGSRPRLGFFRPSTPEDFAFFVTAAWRAKADLGPMFNVPGQAHDRHRGRGLRAAE